MTPEPYLLDLDGTLIDSLADIAASANWLRQSFGLAPVPLAVARGFIGDGVSKLMARALAELGPFEPHRERAWQVYAEHHDAQCTKLVKLYAGVREHLLRWRAEGRPLAVVTNKSSRFTAKILAHLGIAELLPVAVCGDQVPHKKPRPEPLRIALEQLGLPQGRGLMAGDGLQDLQAGKAAGLRTAACLFGFRAPEVLRAEGADEYWSQFGVREILGVC